MVNLSTVQQILGKDKLRTRFAPGVTGRLHLGHIVNAIYVWGISQAMNGEVLLRLEDHSRARWKQEFEYYILDDLERLGFMPDIGLFSQFRELKTSEFRQSDCQEYYIAALDKLRKNFNVYACDCRYKGTMASWQGEYDGHCRARGLKWQKGLRLRVEIENSHIEFFDILSGIQKRLPSEFKGDPELINFLGDWTYIFAVVVDDYRHNINTVIRGNGLLKATACQISLARMLGYTPPKVWLHHDEIIDPLTLKKLSKRDGAASVGQMINSGYTTTDILLLAIAETSLNSKVYNQLNTRNLGSLFK
jgi:glutamyl/glutaminyl-tRNA synthetase